MGIEEFKDSPKGKTINTIDVAIQAVRDAHEYLGHSPTTREFDRIREEIGYSTSAGQFKRDIGKTFNEVKEIADLSKCQSSIDFTEDMKKDTELLGYVIGVILGDGSVYSTNQGSKVIKLDSKDKEFVEEFAERFCEWSNLDWDGWKSEDTEISCYGPIDTKGNSEDEWRCQKGIVPLYDYLIYYQCGKWSIKEIMDKSKDFKIGLLRGLWDSEGSISSNKVYFTNTNKNINLLYMKLVQDLIGVHFSIEWSWCSNKKSGRRYGEFTVSAKNEVGSRTITFPNKYNATFYSIVEPTIDRKREKFKDNLYK